MTRIFSFIVFLIATIFGGLLWIFITTPNAKTIVDCIKTKKYEVYLCESSPNYTRLTNISHSLKSLVLIAEDSAFYGHAGFDWKELEKSFEENLSEVKFSRGGSTITQQLAKNVFLPFDKSIARKIREALIVTEIEKLLTKDKIFEKYLNVIELGPRLYGVGPASLHYFGKSPATLNILESAYLTYLIPNPKVYSRNFNLKKLTPYSRYRILDLCYKMYRYKKISLDQYTASKEAIDFFPWADLDVSLASRLRGESTPPPAPEEAVVTPPEEIPFNDETIPVVEPSSEELAEPISDSPFNN